MRLENPKEKKLKQKPIKISIEASIKNQKTKKSEVEKIQNNLTK
jgi:hypothetical protein